MCDYRKYDMMNINMNVNQLNIMIKKKYMQIQIKHVAGCSLIIVTKMKKIKTL